MSFMHPMTPSFIDYSKFVILGSITPGVSTKKARGSSQIFIPVTDLVVQGNGVYLAKDLRLSSFGVVYLS